LSFQIYASSLSVVGDVPASDFGPQEPSQHETEEEEAGSDEGRNEEEDCEDDAEKRRQRCSRTH
jgi:hypothetical protein